MRTFSLFEGRFLLFAAVLVALRLGGGQAWQAAELGEFPGYAVAIVLGAGALLTWALGHGMTPDRSDFRRTPGMLSLAVRGKAAFDDSDTWSRWHPTEGQARWLHAASAGLGVGAVVCLLWAAAHDPERMGRFVDAVGPLGVAVAVGVILFAALLWAGWDLIFPPPDDEPPAEA